MDVLETNLSFQPPAMLTIGHVLVLMSTNYWRDAFHILLAAIAAGGAIGAMPALGSSGQQPPVQRPLDATGPITYFIADGNESTGFRASDRQLAIWALDAWQRHADGRLRFDAVTESAALIRLYWAPPIGGRYGEIAPLIVSGRRGAAVYIRPDVESLGPEIARRPREDVLLRECRRIFDLSP